MNNECNLNEEQLRTEIFKILKRSVQSIEEFDEEYIVQLHLQRIKEQD